MNFEKKDTPEIRMAPEHKPINMDKFPKRKVEEAPKFYEMTHEQLLAFMCSTMRFKYDPLRYINDTRYKAKADSILLQGLIAMMVDYLRDKGINLDQVMSLVEKPKII